MFLEVNRYFPRNIWEDEKVLCFPAAVLRDRTIHHSDHTEPTSLFTWHNVFPALFIMFCLYWQKKKKFHLSDRVTEENIYSNFLFLFNESEKKDFTVSLHLPILSPSLLFSIHLSAFCFASSIPSKFISLFTLCLHLSVLISHSQLTSLTLVFF